MKSQINPVVGGVIVVIILAVVGVLLWKGTGGGASKPNGAVGNPSPFAPGGAANGQGGKPNVGPPGRPGIGGPPATGGTPGKPAGSG